MTGSKQYFRQYCEDIDGYTSSLKCNAIYMNERIRHLEGRDTLVPQSHDHLHLSRKMGKVVTVRYRKQ